MSEKTEFATIAGGTELDVLFTDGRAERVMVRQLPIRHLGRLGAAWGNEAREIDVYCDKPGGWSESLADESFEAVIEEGRRLNFTRFSKWQERQAQVELVLEKNPAKRELMDRVAASLEKAVLAQLGADLTLPKPGSY